MRFWLTTLVLMVAAGYLASTCFVAVDETEFVIIKQFGKPVRTVLEPGLQYKWPYPVQTAVRYDNRLQVLEDPGAGQPAKEYLTKDKKNIEVTTSTCWRIHRDAGSLQRFVEAVGDMRTVGVYLVDIVRDAFNAELGSSSFDTLVSIDPSRRAWTEKVAGIQASCAGKALQEFGIEIVDLRIQRLSYPAQNRRSVFDRMRAERERIATQYRSEGDAEAMRIRARAQAEQARIIAEAEAEAAGIRGDAEAQATLIYGEAYSVDPEFYRLVRTLESYERGIDADTVLILPAESDFFKLFMNPQIDGPFIADPPTPEIPTLGDASDDDKRQS